jgi:PelA/Pel-15E family pectate lyase
MLRATARASTPPARAAALIAAIGVLACVHGGGQQTAVPWDAVLDQPPSWYATGAARAMADAVLLHQRESGGWPKDLDMTRPPAGAAAARAEATIDNGATTTQIRVLAHVGASAGAVAARRYQTAALRGIDYLLRAQYSNGGWPQIFPPRRDYSRYITFNDDAMVNVLTLLREVSANSGPFGFVDEDRRRRAGTAVDRGTAVVLESQIEVQGTLTAWCAQHDEVTLEPRAARTFEPAALSGAESVGIVRFLMRQPATPRVAGAIHAAVAWLERVRLPDGRWARFYEFGTNRPIFAGRDGVVRYNVDEIERERREGYAWFGTWPKKLLEQEYPAWKTRTGQPLEF